MNFDKAYDFVNWDFVDYMLRRFGFDAKCCDWMRTCVFFEKKYWSLLTVALLKRSTFKEVSNNLMPFLHSSFSWWQRG
jgi:hypothetical protein